MSIPLNEEDLSPECLRTFTDIQPYAGDLASNLVRFVKYPIMVPMFHKIEAEIKGKEFVFNQR